ncbi:unnamed protein product, partial [Musa acuminata var. zebrina]
ANTPWTHPLHHFKVTGRRLPDQQNNCSWIGYSACKNPQSLDGRSSGHFVRLSGTVKLWARGTFGFDPMLKLSSTSLMASSKQTPWQLQAII